MDIQLFTPTLTLPLRGREYTGLAAHRLDYGLEFIDAEVAELAPAADEVCGSAADAAGAGGFVGLKHCIAVVARLQALAPIPTSRDRRLGQSLDHFQAAQVGALLPVGSGGHVVEAVVQPCSLAYRVASWTYNVLGDHCGRRMTKPTPRARSCASPG